MVVGLPWWIWLVFGANLVVLLGMLYLVLYLRSFARAIVRAQVWTIRTVSEGFGVEPPPEMTGRIFRPSVREHLHGMMESPPVNEGARRVPLDDRWERTLEASADLDEEHPVVNLTEEEEVLLAEMESMNLPDAEAVALAQRIAAE